MTAWARRHPGPTVAGLLALAALLGWAGYRGYRSATARGHFRAAQQALDRRDWSMAREQLEACLSSCPDDSDAHRLAARAARRLDLLDEAQRHLAACERLAGGESQATKIERALLRVHRGDLASEEEFLRYCIAQDAPDAGEILDVLSTALILDYRVPEAHQCLEELLRRQPNDCDILLRRAFTAQSQGWYTVAVESRQRALELRPDADSVRLELVDNLLTLGRYAEAREQLAALRRKWPDHPGVLFSLARCLAEQGEKDRAVELLDRLLVQEPNNPSVCGERGRLCLERDRPEEALIYLRRATAQSPPNRTLLLRLADCLRLLGKHDEARPYLEQAEGLQSDTVLALQLSKRYREGGRNDADLCHQLGVVLLRLGKTDDARRFFRKALKINPNHRPAQKSLAAIEAGAGDGQAAYLRPQLEQSP